MSKLQVVNEIHKQARKNFQRRSVILKGIGDLWQADLIDLQSYSKFNKGYKYVLTIIDAFSKFAWVVPLKSKAKRDVKIAMELILKNNCAPKNLQTDMGKEFYNSEFKHLIKLYSINHYSTFSVKKASIVERLIRTLKSKLFKHFSFSGSYRWIGNPLNGIVNSYNNSVHKTTKYKPVNVNKNNESIIMKNIKTSQIIRTKPKHKFKVGDSVRISKYKADFKKGYTPNWSTEIFTIFKVKKTNPVTYNIEDQKKQTILGSFYEQELQKTKYPDIYLVEKVLRRKGHKLYVKWLGLNHSENCWIDQNSVV